ncbi:MAG: hypothetical protein U5J64_00715 [Halobacteriales archaeon]|nr:hypothetical protein [Halobacteriales archaeon]
MTGTAGAAMEVDSCTTIDESNAPADGLVELNTSITDSNQTTCFEISADDIVFDGMGNTVDSNASANDFGFNVINSTQTLTNVTVQNVTVTDWFRGIQVTDAATVRNTQLSNVAQDIRTASGSGALIEDNVMNSAMRVSASSAVIRNNTVTNDNVNFFGTSDNLFINNTVTNGDGVWFTAGSNNNTVKDSEITGNTVGIRFYRDDSTDRVLNTTLDNNDVAVSIEGSSNNIVRNSTTVGSDYVVNSTTSGGEISVNNLLENMQIDASTSVTLSGRNYSVRSVASPPADPNDADSIGKYLEATRLTSGTSFLDMTFFYTETDTVGLDESNIAVWRYDGSWAELASNLDTTANTVNANTSSFSTFAPLVGEAVDEVGCVNRRNLSRGQESQECPTDREISRGESRRDFDRSTGRSSDTSRRDRGR